MNVPKILSLQKITALRIEQWHLIQALPTDRLLQLMGMLNCYTYCIADKWKVITLAPPTAGEPETSRIWGIQPERLKELASACIDGFGEVTTTVLWMQKYLSKHWKGACNSCPSIRKMRLFMRDILGLFQFVPQKKGETVVPPDIQQIDLEKMLITFEMCERELLTRGELPEGELIGSEMNHFMPKHKGALVVKIFDTLFTGITSYCRSQELDVESAQVVLPEVTDIPCSTVVWQWSHCYDIARKIWVNLAKKYQRVTGKIIDIEEPESVAWDEVEAKTDEWMREYADIPY